MIDIDSIQKAAIEAGFESVTLDTHHPKREELHFQLEDETFPEFDPVQAALDLVDADLVDMGHFVPLYPAPIVRVVLKPDALPVIVEPPSPNSHLQSPNSNAGGVPDAD